MIEPKMNPTYPWRRKADGMPTMVITLSALWSNATDRSPVSREYKARVRWMNRITPFSCSAHAIMSVRWTNQISRRRTAIRYQA